MAQIISKERDLISWLENKVSALSSTSTNNNNSVSVDVSASSSAFFDDEILIDHQNGGKNRHQNGSSTTLGGGGGLWNCRNVSSLLNAELLTEIQSCFVDLQTPVKLKLLLSILHLSRRNMDQWRNELEDVLSLAGQDIDEWVQTVAELLKDVPSLGALNFNVHDDQNQFTKTLAHLKKMLKKQPLNQSLLPKDAAFVNKNAVQTIWASNFPSPTTTTTAKHFNLRRKTKAAAQRAELLLKSHDAPNQSKIRSALLSHHVPIKGRDTVRKMDTNTPMKGIPSQNPNKLSAGFSTTSKMYTRPVITKKEGGAKLIDITETPEMLKKRRKEIEKEEKANIKLQREEQRRKREQEREEARELKRKMAAEQAAAAAAPQNDAVAFRDDEMPPPTAADDVEPSAPPSYMVDLLQAVNVDVVEKTPPASFDAETKKRQREKAILAYHFPPIQVGEKDRFSGIVEENVDEKTPTPPPFVPTPVITAPISNAYLFNAVSSPSGVRHDDHNFAARLPTLTSTSTFGGSAAAANFARAFYHPPTTQQQQGFSNQNQETPLPPPTGVVRVDMPGQSQSLYFRPSAIRQQNPSADCRQENPSADCRREKTPAANLLNFYGSPTPPPQDQQNLVGGESSNFGISRNVVMEAQEMFKTANKLTRPEKALILGFMAGNRDNPCPQMGSVLTVRLSENVENQLQMDGMIRQALIETYFQMNYENGEWKKLRKTRVL